MNLSDPEAGAVVRKAMGFTGKCVKCQVRQQREALRENSGSNFSSFLLCYCNSGLMLDIVCKIMDKGSHGILYVCVCVCVRACVKANDNLFSHGFLKK
jgi:hypothetical protein